MSKFVQVTVLALVLLVSVSQAARRPTGSIIGGLGGERDADEDVRKILRTVHEQFEEKYGQKFNHLEAVSYRKQVVAGYNYFVRVIAHTEDGEKLHAHVQIYHPIHRPYEIIELRKDLEADSPLWPEAYH